jgi:hypothetical protein
MGAPVSGKTSDTAPAPILGDNFLKMTEVNQKIGDILYSIKISND